VRTMAYETQVDTATPPARLSGRGRVVFDCRFSFADLPRAVL